jgi:hypothetical protein
MPKSTKKKPSSKAVAAALKAMENMVLSRQTSTFNSSRRGEGYRPPELPETSAQSDLPAATRQAPVGYRS